MKVNHEKKVEKSDFKIDEAELMKLLNKANKYSKRITTINKNHLSEFPEFAMSVSGEDSFSDVMDRINETIKTILVFLGHLHDSDKELIKDFEELLDKKGLSPKLFQDIPYYKHPFYNRNWEFHNLAKHNLILVLKIDLVHAEVHFWTEFLKTHSADREAMAKLKKARETLEEYSKTAAYAD